MIATVCPYEKGESEGSRRLVASMALAASMRPFSRKVSDRAEKTRAKRKSKTPQNRSMHTVAWTRSAWSASRPPGALRCIVPPMLKTSRNTHVTIVATSQQSAPDRPCSFTKEIKQLQTLLTLQQTTRTAEDTP
eukprot:scaffold3256_cov114-Isochrysis_galbana.AAC.7